MSRFLWFTVYMTHFVYVTGVCTIQKRFSLLDMNSWCTVLWLWYLTHCYVLYTVYQRSQTSIPRELRQNFRG